MGRPSDHPTFRVRGKNFVFSDQAARDLSLKLPKEEAASVVATDTGVSPAGYGLGRHGWVALTVDDDADDERWRQVEEWVRTSYTFVTPKRQPGSSSRRTGADEPPRGEAKEQSPDQEPRLPQEHPPAHRPSATSPPGCRGHPSR